MSLPLKIIAWSYMTQNAAYQFKQAYIANNIYVQSYYQAGPSFL